jgi:hypothetical protein
MGIPRKQKPSPAAGEFLFQLDPEPLEECVTAYAGIPLFLQAARSLEVPRLVNLHLQIKQRDRGLDEAGYVARPTRARRTPYAATERSPW